MMREGMVYWFGKMDLLDAIVVAAEYWSGKHGQIANQCHVSSRQFEPEELPGEAWIGDQIIEIVRSGYVIPHTLWIGANHERY